MELQHDQGDSNQREGKVDEREQYLLNRKRPTMHLDLFKQKRSRNDGHEGIIRRLRHSRERDVADEQVQRVHPGRNGAIAALTENGRKHNGHDDHKIKD